MSKYFLDTNIIIYAYSNSEPHKADKANALIFEGASLISLQVINEFSSICLIKTSAGGECRYLSSSRNHQHHGR